MLTLHLHHHQVPTKNTGSDARPSTSTKYWIKYYSTSPVREEDMVFPDPSQSGATFDESGLTLFLQGVTPSEYYKRW